MRFILTVIGILVFGVASVLSDLIGVDTNVFLIIGLILTAIGVIISLVSGDGLKERLIEVGIHAGIWIAGYLILNFLVPAVILVVVVLVADQYLLDGAIRKFIMDKFAGSQSGTWPHLAYDNANNQYVLVKTYGEYADYYCEALGHKVTVSASDVGEKSMSTVYGTLHW